MDPDTARKGRHKVALWHIRGDTLPATTSSPDILVTTPEKTVDTPRIWALLGDKAGDNAQVLALAGALGWPVATKRLAYRSLRKLPNLLFGASLATLDRAASEPLTPPWPDLVIAVGRRSVPVARWIRRQSGGQARLVQIGRPRAPIALFDLVITTPQYATGTGPNVIELPLPIATPAARQAADRFAGLPEPRIVVLTGGPAAAFPLDLAAADMLHRRLEAMARRWAGSLLVTTSRRTPKDVADRLLGGYAVPASGFGFGTTSGPSPYPDLLAAGDIFVVTADSASMLADAVATGRPVFVFGNPAPAESLPLSWRLSRSYGPGGADTDSTMGRLYRWLLDRGMLYGPRRLDLVSARLYREGMVQELPATPPPEPPAAPVRQGAMGLDLVVGRVRQLMRRG
jgi:uncharacterized protein